MLRLRLSAPGICVTLTGRSFYNGKMKMQDRDQDGASKGTDETC
jgi:hypothetical protein